MYPHPTNRVSRRMVSKITQVFLGRLKYQSVNPDQNILDEGVGDVWSEGLWKPAY